MQLYAFSVLQYKTNGNVDNPEDVQFTVINRVEDKPFLWHLNSFCPCLLDHLI